MTSSCSHPASMSSWTFAQDFLVTPEPWLGDPRRAKPSGGAGRGSSCPAAHLVRLCPRDRHPCPSSSIAGHWGPRRVTGCPLGTLSTAAPLPDPVPTWVAYQEGLPERQEEKLHQGPGAGEGALPTASQKQLVE